MASGGNAVSGAPGCRGAGSRRRPGQGRPASLPGFRNHRPQPGLASGSPEPHPRVVSGRPQPFLLGSPLLGTGPDGRTGRGDPQLSQEDKLTWAPPPDSSWATTAQPCASCPVPTPTRAPALRRDILHLGPGDRPSVRAHIPGTGAEAARAPTPQTARSPAGPGSAVPNRKLPRQPVLWGSCSWEQGLPCPPAIQTWGGRGGGATRPQPSSGWGAHRPPPGLYLQLFRHEFCKWTSRSPHPCCLHSVTTPDPPAAAPQRGGEKGRLEALCTPSLPRPHSGRPQRGARGGGWGVPREGRD